MGRKDRILAFIVAGSPPDCFPPALRQDEPIAADARKEGDGPQNAKLKLLAGMLGVSFDALKQRDTQRRIRRLQVALLLVALLVGVFGVLAWYANHQRQLARANEVRAVDALANSDFREGIRRLGEPQTTSEGVAFLARAARLWNTNDRARGRLWTLLQQRRFWVEAPSTVDAFLDAPGTGTAAIDPKFAEVDYNGRKLPCAGFARSVDGKVFVTLVNDDDSINARVHHFRAWRADGKPLTKWIECSDADLDIREVVAAHLSADGRYAAIVSHVWREPQLIQIWDTQSGTKVGDPIRATGRDPKFQEATFTQLRFVMPTKTQLSGALLLAATSRGDATLFNIEDKSVGVLGICQHATAVLAAAVDSDAHWLMSASADQQAMVWDLAENHLLGNTIALPDVPTRIGRISPDSVRVQTANSGAIEYKLMPALSVPVPAGAAIPAAASTHDQERPGDDTTETARGVALPALVTVLDRSPDGRRIIRLLSRTEIEVTPADGSTGAVKPWRHRFTSPVWHVKFDDSGNRVVAQDVAFITGIFDSETGQASGAAIDETRNFPSDTAPPSRPLSTSLTPAGGLVLTRSYFWDPPNAAHYWFTVWDGRSGLPLSDAEHLTTTGFEKDNEVIDAAAFSADATALLLGSPKGVRRSIQLAVPEAFAASLPDVAEAYGGLRVELDGSFSPVSDRLTQLEGFLDRWPHAVENAAPAK
jgi:hypothetical protein